MMTRRMNGKMKKVVSALLVLSINLLPLQGVIPLAHATGGLNIPANEQPQVLIILDNSQGMAGALQGTSSYSTQSSSNPIMTTSVSGAIMTGSGTVSQNTTSSSPPYYQTSGFVPPAYGLANQVVPYTVSCGASGLTAAALSACASINDQGYVDNSPSMLNAVEVSLRNVLGTPMFQNIQFGLEDYLGAYTYAQTSSPTNLFNTWVYYMSSPPNPESNSSEYQQDFSFGSSSNIPTGYNYSIANPCYNSNSVSCTTIASKIGGGQPSPVTSDPYLYIYDSSDNPIINDVLYATGHHSNFLSGSFNGFSSNYSQSGYEEQVSNNSPIWSYYQHITTSPTSAGYIPSSYDVWYSERGYAFNNNVLLSASGNMVVPVAVTTSTQITALNFALSPEVFQPGINYASAQYPVSASAGYSPVAGAFQTALNYLQGKSAQISSSMPAPPSTCGNKYVIFITDGQPTMGTGGKVYPPLGSAAASDFNITGITASTWSTTNNNAVVEAVNMVQQLAAANAGAGIKTYVLGVGSAVAPVVSGTTSSQQQVALQGQAVLTALAQAGGTGSYYSALTQSGVQSALNSIVANILGKSVVSSYAAPPSVTVGSLEFLLKDVNPVTGQGDLYAYPITSNGSVSSTASWTANNNAMTTRSSNLYTTPLTPLGQSTPSTFSAVASTDSTAFGITNTALTASDIAQYTINPSYNSGQYLGGRQSGWYVGLPSSAPAEVLTPPDNANLIGNGGSYLSFAASHANRQNAVLFSDNDGFLYALGYNNTGTGSPTLLWGWMPGALLPALQNYPTFWQGNNMGDFSTIDAWSTSDSKWHTYVVGTANNGGVIGYDLQLNDNNNAPNLGSVIAQVSWLGYSQPQPSAPVFYQVQNPSASNYGTAWALFALNSSAGSDLAILNVAAGAVVLDSLPFTNTATPYIDQYGDLFLGDSSGNVYEMSASTLTSLLSATSSSSIPSTDFTNIGNYAPWASSSLKSNVQFIGGSFYQGANYLRVQGPNGITVFKQINSSWAPVWTAYSGGAESWSGATPSPSSTISALPSGSTITDQALINGGSVIVPVTIPAPSGSCGYSTAEYYLYNLSSGIFPSGAFVSPTGGVVTQGYLIGRGSAYTPSVTIFNGRAMLQGAASQNTTGGTSGFASALGSGLPTGGPVAWRLLMTP